LNNKSFSWSRLSSNGLLPGGRSSHSINVIGTKIFVYGGEDTPRHGFDENIRVYDMKINSWEIPHVTGDIPSLRLAHATTAIDKTLWVIGGREDKNDINDVYTFDTETNIWNKKITSEGFPICSYHSVVSINNFIYIFGGCSGNSGRLNTIFKLDTEKLVWSQLEAKGDLPVARGGPGFCHLNNSLFVYGGYTGKEELDDLYRFDLESETWIKIIPNGVIPSARSVHVTTTLGNGIITFGGEFSPSAHGHEGAGKYLGDTWYYDLVTNAWNQIDVSEQAPTPRGWMAASALPTNDGVVLFGGFDGESRLNDLYLLS